MALQYQASYDPITKQTTQIVLDNGVPVGTYSGNTITYNTTATNPTPTTATINPNMTITPIATTSPTVAPTGTGTVTSSTSTGGSIKNAPQDASSQTLQNYVRRVRAGTLSPQAAIDSLSNFSSNTVNQFTSWLNSNGYAGTYTVKTASSPTTTVNGSIVDYLNSVGQPSDYTTRSKLAAQYGITNYTGTAAQNTQLLGILKTQQSSGTTSGTNPLIYKGVSLTNGTDAQIAAQKAAIDAKSGLPATTSPSNALDISKIGNIKLPDVTFGSGDIASATASANAIKAKLDALVADQEAGKNSLADYLKSLPNTAQLRSNAYSEAGINPAQYFADQKARLAEIDTLTKDYNDTVAKRDQQIAATQDKLASMNFINNQTAQITRNAAPLLNNKSANINAKVATMQALQGNFSEATKFVNQAVEDATADQKAKVDAFKLFYSINQDEISQLNSEYKTALNRATDLATAAYNAAVAEKKSIGELLMENPDAGINIYNDTLQDAQQKVAASGGTLAARREARLAAANGGTGSGTTNFIDLLQKARDTGMSPSEAARDVAAYSESLGFPVDQKTLNSWTVQAGNLKVNSTSTASTTNPNTIPFEGQTIGQGQGGQTEVGAAFSNVVSGISNWFKGLF